MCHYTDRRHNGVKLSDIFLKPPLSGVKPLLQLRVESRDLHQVLLHA